MFMFLWKIMLFYDICHKFKVHVWYEKTEMLSQSFVHQLNCKRYCFMIFVSNYCEFYCDERDVKSYVGQMKIWKCLINEFLGG